MYISIDISIAICTERDSRDRQTDAQRETDKTGRQMQRERQTRQADRCTERDRQDGQTDAQRETDKTDRRATVRRYTSIAICPQRERDSSDRQTDAQIETDRQMHR